MENTDIAKEQRTEDFNFKEHALSALLGAAYYLLVYIPFILPFTIWGKAATRLSKVWEEKSLGYDEAGKSYPLFSFYLVYLVDFFFDALILLTWPILGLYTLYEYIMDFDIELIVEAFLIPIFIVYISALTFRAAKEVVFFILNTLISWVLDVIKNIGKLIKNIWLLNFVIKRKD